MPKFSKDYQPDRSKATRHPPFSSTNQPANRGTKTRIHNLPKDAREQITAALWHALSLPDQKTAQEYLIKTAKDLPQFGYLIQVYAKGMMGKNGILYVSDLLDRILGKPRQQTDVTIGPGTGGVQITVGSPEAAAGLRSALADGAKPADPETPTED